MGHLLVLDEDMLPRLAGVELIGRGRPALALKHTEAVGLADPEVIACLGSWTDTMLITTDDNMPSEHGAAIASTGLTIAVVAPRTDDRFSELSWEREIVHRWVHVMAEQEPGSIIRYTPSGHSVWRPRKRTVKLRRLRRRASLTTAHRLHKPIVKTKDLEPTLPFD